ncbi:MAG: DUF4301 family protein [Flavobacteriales bacterium]|nr:DUF4301 family protein [Flavobacteriales bacterium]
MKLSPSDIAQLNAHGISTEKLVAQTHALLQGVRPVRLERACIAGDGILIPPPAECNRLLRYFEEHIHRHRAIRFVPASGAATRMFRHLFSYQPDGLSDAAEEFILHFEEFPFIPALESVLQRKGKSLADLVTRNDWGEIFHAILDEDGLGYARCPKGMVIFHRYGHEMRTAFEEHIAEFLQYGKDRDGRYNLHFTVSPQQLDPVSKFLREKAAGYAYDEIEVSCSHQDPSTDVIALDKHNEPARDESGRLLIRPAGHGALLSNLQAMDADIIFIHNIDNVSTAAHRTETIFYRKIAGGLLLELRTAVFDLLDALDRNEPEAMEKAIEFIQIWFQPGVPLGMPDDALRAYVRMRLDRPLRVCGMVRNEGEPGGGPFWVQQSDGVISKQIIEKSQVDTHDPLQARILSSATHFNPVDIVCSIRNRHGSNYRLENFVDHGAGFISEKFQDGRVIRAYELPGLWNGSMAMWNTVFLEVPVSTFHPVKSVNDLLRPGHRS